MNAYELYDAAFDADEAEDTVEYIQQYAEFAFLSPWRDDDDYFGKSYYVSEKLAKEMLKRKRAWERACATRLVSTDDFYRLVEEPLSKIELEVL